jgi:predicted nucleotidyltransferase
MTGQIHTALEEITKRLVSEFQPEQIFLFGSYAWGIPDEDSDLDVLVVVSESPEKSSRRATRAYRCLRGIGTPADVLVKTRSEVDALKNAYASLVSEILDKGILLYG